MTALAVIGTGYVGLTTGACFAHLGHDVICADIDVDKVARLERGESPIVEERIEELIAEGLETGRLRFTDSPAAAVSDCEIAFLCVPTPSLPDGSVDLAFIESAVEMIDDALPPGAVVATKSTVPVGSTRVVEQTLGRHDVAVVSNPEFLREGTAVQDFLAPDRVVIGSDDPEASARVAALYEPLGAPVVITDPATAETVKYVANAFLATKLSFVNAIAAVCEAVGADVDDVMVSLGHDRRIGPEYLQPGPGWGGSCFPKDTRALLQISEEAGYPFRFLEGVLEVTVFVDVDGEEGAEELRTHQLMAWVADGGDGRAHEPALGVVTLSTDEEFGIGGVLGQLDRSGELGVGVGVDQGAHEVREVTDVSHGDLPDLLGELLADLGPEAQRTGDIATILGVKVTSLGPVRAKLIRKGMIYSPAHGDLAFTVPLFDEFMVRAIPDFESKWTS